MNFSHLRTSSAPATVRLGRDIAQRGRIDIVEEGRHRLIATVKPPDGQRRTVTITDADGDVAWTCTCSKKKLYPCKHVAALLIATEAPA